MSASTLFNRFSGRRSVASICGGRSLYRFGIAAGISSSSSRSFAAESPPVISTKPPQIPWLMLESWNIPSSIFFYDPIAEKIIHRTRHSMRIAQRVTVSSSQGFIFYVDFDTADLQAVNPLTGARIALPPTASLPTIARPTFGFDGKISDYVLSKTWSEFDLHYNPRLSLRRDPEGETIGMHDMRLFYFTKAILSPSRDKVVVIEGGHSGQLAFARLGGDVGVGGDDDVSFVSPWTALDCDTWIFDDIIFHKGCLHAVNVDGTLAVFDLDHGDEPRLSLALYENPVEDEFYEWMRFLVESPDGDDLFLVLRELEDFSDVPLLEDPIEYWTVKVPRTKNFKVFKLDKSNYKWNRVDTIGELALFLGKNHSVSLAACDFPNLKANSIYFNDDYMRLWGKHRITNPYFYKDRGIFNLEDRSIQPFRNQYDNLQHWDHIIWYMPVM